MLNPRRLMLLTEHRQGYRQVYQIHRSIELLTEALDTANELFHNAQAALAVELLRNGPIEFDGRRYEHVIRDGCHCVQDSPIDDYLTFDPSQLEEESVR